MNILSTFKNINHFIFDVDGVLTDGSLLVESNGHLARTMNIKDGYALQLAIKKGYDIIIITGGNSEGVRLRLASLGIAKYFGGVKDKVEVLNTLGSQIDLAKTLYMGDDMPDYNVMAKVYLPACPQDACAEIQHLATYISPYSGGRGCVRDVIEKVLKLNNHWQ